MRVHAVLLLGSVPCPMPGSASAEARSRLLSLVLGATATRPRLRRTESTSWVWLSPFYPSYWWSAHYHHESFIPQNKRGARSPSLFASPEIPMQTIKAEEPLEGSSLYALPSHQRLLPQGRCLKIPWAFLHSGKKILTFFYFYFWLSTMSMSDTPRECFWMLPYFILWCGHYYLIFQIKKAEL